VTESQRKSTNLFVTPLTFAKRMAKSTSTSVVISVKLQKATITAAGAHVHTVKNNCNWTKGVTVVGRYSVSSWLREREEM
jgi:hypothetical protein